MEKGNPIAYTGVPVGLPVVSGDLQEFGTVEHVLEVPTEDLFDGIAVHTSEGLRFVDRDQIAEITDTCVVTAVEHRASRRVAGAERHSGLARRCARGHG